MNEFEIPKSKISTFSGCGVALRHPLQAVKNVLICCSVDSVTNRDQCKKSVRVRLKWTHCVPYFNPIRVVLKAFFYDYKQNLEKITHTVKKLNLKFLEKLSLEMNSSYIHIN